MDTPDREFEDAKTAQQFLAYIEGEGPYLSNRPSKLPGKIRKAARRLLSYVSPSPEAKVRHTMLTHSFENLLVALIANTPASQERSRAINHIRDAKMLASAAVALHFKSVPLPGQGSPTKEIYREGELVDAEYEPGAMGGLGSSIGWGKSAQETAAPPTHPHPLDVQKSRIDRILVLQKQNAYLRETIREKLHEKDTIINYLERRARGEVQADAREEPDVEIGPGDRA